MMPEKKFLKIGHRGACGYKQENTIPSFVKAIELGADMIEFDVHLCKSGELVVIHDDELAKTTNGMGRVRDMTLTELKKVDAGDGCSIPTAREVLDVVGPDILVNIELKSSETALPVVELIDIENDKWSWGASSRFLVSSFKRDALAKFRMFDPFTKVGIVCSSLQGDLFSFARSLNCYSINVPIIVVTEELVEEAHEKGFKVLVWTVNFQQDILRMINMGVDGIFSDFPDRLLGHDR